MKELENEKSYRVFYSVMKDVDCFNYDSILSQVSEKFVLSS